MSASRSSADLYEGPTGVIRRRHLDGGASAPDASEASEGTERTEEDGGSEADHRPAEGGSIGSGQGASPLAMSAMSARLMPPSIWRIWSPTWAQTARSTHWPSWSQAPFWGGSPKSPAAMGPSTALTISDRAIWRGGRASTYPPPTPRLERTSPAPLRARRICSR